MRDVVLRAEDVELVAGDDPVGHQALHGIHGNISVGQDGCLQLALHFLELDIIKFHSLLGGLHDLHNDSLADIERAAVGCK